MLHGDAKCAAGCQKQLQQIGPAEIAGVDNAGVHTKYEGGKHWCKR